MGLLAACVYRADKALPLHNTYIHKHVNLLVSSGETIIKFIL